ncbi:MAG: enoyl-CoA hydratase/isomerase family protein, partial [Burkholderiaceae bacterium]
MKMQAEVLFEVRGETGFISLNRPKALNALNLAMIRMLTAQLLAWRDDATVTFVAIRGMSKPSAEGLANPFGNFSAGGDIRFFHQAALAGNPEMEDFFTEEYQLNHLIATYPKPYIALMDGIIIGGGMGISQGASLRIVTERTKMSMPETGIGLFPDVGGGYFLSRCPGRVGEYLALTGVVIGADEAIAYGLADQKVEVSELPALWQELSCFDAVAALECKSEGVSTASELKITTKNIALQSVNTPAMSQVDHYFALPTVTAIVHALEASTDPWALQTAHILRSRSPLMLHVTLEQIRRGRQLDLVSDLQMERDLVRHCFHTAHLGRHGVSSETVEGIRALAVDKDHQPKWQPARIEDVTPEMVLPFFNSP